MWNDGAASGLQARVEAPALNTLAGDAPHPDDPTFRHALVQPQLALADTVIHSFYILTH